MSYEPWPSPDSPRGPLPRLEDLPVADQGYDQESVRAAFDSFYRHAAQLDASLKALEAVDAFRRDAYELRNDLRSLRSIGFGAPEPSTSWTPTYAPAAPRFEIPSAVPRLVFEAGVIVAVAVICGVAHFRAWLIVVLMAAAWAIVGLSEWLAARSRFAVPAGGFVPEPAVEQPSVVEETAAGWAAYNEPEPEPEPEVEPEPEELTVVAAAEPNENADGEEPVEPEANGGRRRWFRRRHEESAEQAEPEPEPAGPPSHVHVRRR
jgi:hypothetical protein